MTPEDPIVPAESVDFIRAFIKEDLAAGRMKEIVTRFPPEPNGYLHIGHAKAFSLDFGVALEFGGHCNLRFDDTNPVKEDVEYVDSIQEDIRWLGYDWGEHLYHASDYYEQLYEWAEKLIRDGKAYVCDLSADQVREHRGTLTEAGRPSPFRDRTVDENLDIFRRMRAGEFDEGSRTLRAKIDMAAPQHEPPRPDHVPDHQGEPPSHGGRLVHLPVLRLGPRPVGRDRGDHALALLAGIRDPPAAL